MKEQINLQVSFNPKNQSHMKLLNWINTQTTNKSSFIRETILMRMIGSFIPQKDTFESQTLEVDVDEVLKLIQI